MVWIRACCVSMQILSRKRKDFQYERNDEGAIHTSWEKAAGNRNQAYTQRNQRLVGGIISAYSPFDNGSVIILNDTGKIDGLEFNRVVYDENGEIADIIAGDFFICYASPDRPEFSSLPDELIQKYSELFKTPKSFIRIDGKLIIVPAGDQQ